ncbi:MAG: tetratricopeptide repeat protein [bacterium]
MKNNRYSRNGNSDILLSGMLVLLFLLLIGCQPKEVTSAKIYIQNNDWDKALKQLEVAVAAYPKNAEAHYLLGQAYGYHARYEDMIKEFNSSLNISEKFVQQITAERERYWIDKYNAAIIALDKQDYLHAEKFLQTAILIDPEKHEAYKKLAIAYIQTDQLDNALTIYKKLLQKYPRDLDLLISIGNLYYSQKNYDKSVVILKRVLEIEPNHRDALANLALAYDSLGKLEEAEQAFRKAVAANTQDKDLIFLFGVYHYKRNNFEQAIQLFERVLELNPHDFDATSNIGNAYLSMAENLRKKLKQASPADRTSIDYKKITNGAILNYKHAIPYLKKALEMQPNHPNLWRNLGVAYINTGEKELGEKALLKSEEVQVKLSK